MGLGRISPTLPFVNKKAIELLKATYSSNEEASRIIQTTLTGFYQQNYPAISSQRSGDISERRDRDRSNLQPERVSRSESYVGHLPQQSRTYRLPGVLPLP